MALTANQIKFIRSLQQKKNRKAAGLFVVEGIKPVQELLESSLSVEALYTTDRFEGMPDDSVRISPKELSRISGFKSPNTVLALVHIPKDQNVDWNQSTMLLLDGVNDPGNLGTIIRTAKWFGVDTILCSEDCVDAYDRKVVQSSMGALFHSMLIYKNPIELIETAKAHDYSVIGADMNGEAIYSHKTSKKTLLVIGSEANGFRATVKQQLDKLVSIPNFENDQKIESLNAGIASAIILSELKRNQSS